MFEPIRISAQTVYFHYSRVLVFVSLFILFCGISIGLLILANLIPSITSPFVDTNNDKIVLTPTIYERYCNPLGGPCDPLPPVGFTIPSGYGAHIRAALSRTKANQGNFVVAIVGTENEVGLYTSNPDTRSYVSILRIYLQLIGGNGGSGFRYAVASCNVTLPFTQKSLNYSLYQQGTEVALVNNGWNLFYGGGPGAGFLSVASTQIAQAYFYGRGSSIHLLYGQDCYNDPMRTFSTQVDNSVTVSVVGAQNTAACTPTPVGYWVDSLLYTLPDDYHTVLVATTGSQNGELSGARFVNPTGVIVDNYAKGAFDNSSSSAQGVYQWQGGSSYWGSHTTPVNLDTNTAIHQSGASADLFVYAVSPWDIVNVDGLYDQIVSNILTPVLLIGTADIVVLFPLIDAMDAGVSTAWPHGFTAVQVAVWALFTSQMIAWCNVHNVATVDISEYFRQYNTRTFASTGNAIRNMQQVTGATSQWPYWNEQGHVILAQILYPLFLGNYSYNH